MLQRLVCKLDIIEKGEKKYIPGDALHGIIMEHINPDYAYELHQQNSRPYSQYVEARSDGIYWSIQTLTQDAAQQIIDPLASASFSGFHLKRINSNISVTEKTQSEMPIQDLVDLYYFERSERIFRIRFITPTSFKSSGDYVFYPDLRLFFGSLMRKYSSIFESNDEEDSETLGSIVENSKIVRYDLRSVYNEIERVRLPGFCGMIVIKTTGAQPLINYMHFLMKFGEYSGVGIKCAMGMGAMRIISKPGEKTNKVEGVIVGA